MFEEVEQVAVEALVDGAARLLLEGLAAVRDEPAPLGHTPARLSVLAHAAAELQGVYLRELARAEADGEAAAAGCRSTADLLVDAAGLPAWQARADAALARRLAVLPGLLDAVAEGGVELAAARQLARAWTVLPERLQDAPTADALLTLGRLVDLADLRAEVDELVGALLPDVTDDALAAAQESRELTLVGVGAETRLTASTDALTGEWLREVLEAKAEADRGELDGRSPGTRLLDALLDIVRASVGTPAVPGSGSADGGSPLLVVVATTHDLLRAGDAAHGAVVDEPDPEAALQQLLAGASAGTGVEAVPRPGWTAHTRAGTRIGPRSLLALCCTATLTRLLLDPAGNPLDSRPAARQLTRPERRALEHRAGHRCEREGCGRPARSCVPHHVVPWALGGPSTQANTVLLCRSCHHLLHDRRRRLFLTQGRVIGPVGWISGGPPGG